MGLWGVALRAGMGSLCLAEASVCSPTSQLSWALIRAQSPPCSTGASDLGETLGMETRPWGDSRGVTSGQELGVREAETREDNYMSLNLQFKLFLGQDWNNSSPFSPCSFLRLWLVFVAWGTSASRILVWIWIQLWPRILVSLPLCSHTDLHPQPFPDSCRTQGHTPGLLSPEQDTGVSRT